jgi:hypothetical protein
MTTFQEHPCRGCHTVRGLTNGPIGPDLTHLASRTTLAGGMFPRNDSTLAHWLLKASTLKQGSMMPGFPIPPNDLRRTRPLAAEPEMTPSFRWTSLAPSTLARVLFACSPPLVSCSAASSRCSSVASSRTPTRISSRPRSTIRC